MHNYRHNNYTFTRAQFNATYYAHIKIIFQLHKKRNFVRTVNYYIKFQCGKDKAPQKHS